MDQCCLFWFRRDLRLHDNAGLYQALRSGLPIIPVFIFDQNILGDLPDRADARVEFIHRELCHLSETLHSFGSTLVVAHGTPLNVWQEWLRTYRPAAVFANGDYEPYARERDEQIADLLRKHGVAFHSFKDQVIFEKGEVVKADGSPYTVFTPYSKAWRSLLEIEGPAVDSPHLQSFPSENLTHAFRKMPPQAIPALSELGFRPAGAGFPLREVPRSLIAAYDQQRDYPAADGNSRLGLHFRFGTISIRDKVRKALPLNHIFLNELIWREFYAMILWHFPNVVTQSFKPQFDAIRWRNDEQEFRRWKEGRTGYPLVDAGMRELAATGYMHNRVRMVTASFLTKHLLIDWRWGEAWFAQKLLDFELSSNNGGWQWAAGSGTDAAPYFRIFNPELQFRKFDPEEKYVRRWVPEYGSNDYPAPMVEHQFARERCLEAYRVALER